MGGLTQTGRYIRERAAKVEFCEVCEMALWLVGASQLDRTICVGCEEKLQEARDLNEPCWCCGRRWAHQFNCGWCCAPICDGCVHSDHEYDEDCHNPDDYE